MFLEYCCAVKTHTPKHELSGWPRIDPWVMCVLVGAGWDYHRRTVLLKLIAVRTDWLGNTRQVACSVWSVDSYRTPLQNKTKLRSWSTRPIYRDYLESRHLYSFLTLYVCHVTSDIFNIIPCGFFFESTSNIPSMLPAQRLVADVLAEQNIAF